jgi:hypothetical protein
MLLTGAPRTLLVASLLASAACGDFTLVDPLPEGPQLFVHLAAQSDESMRYNLDAAFRPGTDARGRPTEVVDPALYVEGAPVLPDTETRFGLWVYHWQQTPTTGDPDGLVLVTFPLLAGSAPPAHSITIPVTRRTGPADVDLPRGSTLVLGVALANRVTTGLSGGVNSWTLQIRQSCSGNDPGPPLVQIVGYEAHPSELQVPWDWLGAPSTGSLAACFQVSSFFDVVSAPYPANVGVSAQIAWRIHIVDPAP